MFVSGLIGCVNSNSVHPRFTFTMSKHDRAGMRVGMTTLLVLAVVPLSGVAFAAGAPDAGVEVALRTGVALPYGELWNGMKLKSYASVVVPFVVEAGYRLIPGLFLAGRFQYGYAFVHNPVGSCQDISCDGSVITVGAEVLYRFAPEAAFAPWVGVGLGYEWAAADITFSSVPQSANSYSYRGPQGLLQVGGDGRVGRQVVLGPFVEVALGRFDKAEEHTHSADFDATIDLLASPAWHAWFSLGVRGAYGFTSSRR